MSSLLQRLALDHAAYAALPSDVCERVADFLLRWQAFGDALICLDGLSHVGPSQQDQRAAALHGLGRTQEALAVLAERTRRNASLPSAMEHARLQVAAGDVAGGLQAARSLAGGSVPPAQNNRGRAHYPLGPGPLLLADLLLETGSIDEAESILLQLMKDAPEGRQPLLGLARVQLRRGDVLTASAYAMRVLDLSARGPELSVQELTELRTVFQSAGDAPRLREVIQQLVSRFDRELAEAQALIANARGGATGSSALSSALSSMPGSAPSDWAPVSPPAALSSVTVSAKEHHDLAGAARKLFGYKKLLPGQAEVLACVRRGEHVLAVMPTGGGKSLCYQLPAFDGDPAREGITLVVSPLVALMKDQIDGLPPSLRRAAVAVNSSLDGDDLRRIVERIATRQYRLVYVAPERLRQLPFIHALRRAGVARLVVDEAHCVSIWGHDFRPDYLHLAAAHRDLGAPPILAMTATAPPRVRHDIERQLLSAAPGNQPPPMRVLVGDSYRPNLRLSALRVRDDEEQEAALLALLSQLRGQGVVYVRSRQRCDDLAALLVARGVRAAAYHAGLAERSRIQDGFMAGDLTVIVATVAFGMGVDKPDIRFIVHCGLPNSLEGYYQEIGRAGRDGNPSDCILIYTAGDRTTLSRLAAQGQTTVETVHKAYTAVRRALEPQNTGPLPLSVLADTLRVSQTEARMLLGVLEQVGLLQRYYDAPQTLSLQRLPQRGGRRPDGEVLDRAFVDFLHRANLDERSTASGDFASLAVATGLPIESLEACLLAWQSSGFLRFYPGGRTPLVSLLPAPPNAAQRVESLVSRRQAVAEQRVGEIDAYAQSKSCRHALLAEYLGSNSPALGSKPCGACDNCGAGLTVPRLTSGIEPAELVLAALALQSWGRRTLIRLLRGDPAAGERALANSSFGCLADRSEKSLGQLIDSLQAEGLIGQRTLDHGGVTLEITRQGLAALHAAERPGRRKASAPAARAQKPTSAFERWHKKR